MNFRVIFSFLAIIFMIFYISAICENGQIDINQASLEELDKLSGIGPVKAQAIIDTRPFNLVNDLINVYGIGETTLKNIISQNLACVDGEEKDKIQEDEEEREESEETPEEELNNEETEKIAEKIEEAKDAEKEYNATISNEVIVLTPSVTKDIKTKDFTKFRINYPIYGLAAFCVLIGALFLIRRRQGIIKNEFR